MQNIKLIFIFILFTFVPMFANEDFIDFSKMSSNEYFKDMNNSQIDASCEAGHGGTIEYEFCAKRILEKNERHLASTYKEIITAQKAVSSTEWKKILKKILISQKLWLKYREAECKAEYAVIGDGTMRNEQYFYCKASLTESREKELRDFYIDHK